MTSRVVRSWIEAFGTAVSVKASEMTVDMAMKDSVDSLPPSESQHGVSTCLGPDTTFKYSSVTRLDSQRGNVGYHLGARLENNKEDPDRTAHSLQIKSFVQSRS